MDIFRITTITLTLTLLVACGGGGGGGAAAPVAHPLTQFRATENSPSIGAINGILGEGGELIAGNDILASNDGTSTSCPGQRANHICFIQLPGANSDFQMNIKRVIGDLSMFLDEVGFTDEEYTSTITPSETIDGVDFARGSLTGTRDTDNAPLEFETFTGWLDGSIFGTIQTSVGASGSEQYRFISYTIGIPATDNPSATGSETSATWGGAAVATVKENRRFLRGEATITIPDLTDADVDLMFDNWHTVTGQEVSSMPAITYQDLPLTSGAFASSDNKVQGRFYGTDHNEVGGIFYDDDISGAFGGTRQPAQ